MSKGYFNGLVAARMLDLSANRVAEKVRKNNYAAR